MHLILHDPPRNLSVSLYFVALLFKTHKHSSPSYFLEVIRNSKLESKKALKSVKSEADCRNSQKMVGCKKDI